MEVAIAQLYEREPHKLLKLPEEVLQAAIGYQLTSIENDKPAWFIHLTNTVQEFWEIQLDKK